MSSKETQTVNYSLTEPVTGVYEAIMKLGNQWTGGVTLSHVKVTVNNPDGAIWNINLNVDCNGMNNTKSDVETGQQVSWGNVHTNFSKDTNATINTNTPHIQGLLLTSSNNFFNASI